MAATTKCVTLMPGPSLGDMRAYMMSTTKGAIFHAELGLTQDFLDSSREPGFAPGVSEWKVATDGGKFHADSSLCSVAWGAHSWSLFYQDTAGALREYLYSNNRWEHTGFCAGDVLPGTSIAAATASAGGRDPLIFYQNAAGHICASLITRDGTKQGESAARPRTILQREVRRYTGLGACMNRDADTIYVYYQDTEGALRECKGVSDSWNETKEPVCAATGTEALSIAAVRDGDSGVRLYVQYEHGTIVEYRRSNRNWVSHNIETEVKPMPNASTAAISGPYKQQDSRVGLLWIGEDYCLYLADCQGDSSWREPKALLAFHIDTARHGGLAGATPFDSEAEMSPHGTGGRVETEGKAKTRPGKVIKRVVVARGVKGRPDGFQIVYEDGDASAWRGKSSGQDTAFDLGSGEYITHVWYAADEGTVQGFLFGTTNGRQSQWFGHEYGHYGLLQKKGSVLVDLEGSPIDGSGALNAVWEDIAQAGQTTTFQMRYKILYERFLKLRAAVAQLSDTSDGMKVVETRDAAERFELLVQDVEFLYDQEKGLKRAKVNVDNNREDRLQDQLVRCATDLEALLRLLGDLQAKLRPLSGEFDKGVERCQLDGDDLYTDFRQLLDDIEKYRQELNSMCGNFTRQEKLWTDWAKQVEDTFMKDKDKLEEIMATKGLEGLDVQYDHGLPQWGLRTWRARIDPKITQDSTLHHAIFNVQNSNSCLQLHLSQVNFFRINKDLVENLLGRLDKLAIGPTMKQLRDLIDGLHNQRPDRNIELQEAVNLLIAVGQAISALQKAAAAKVVKGFAEPLYSALHALHESKSFTWGKFDPKTLLDVSKGCSAPT